jgi:hypothetical protein
MGMIVKIIKKLSRMSVLLLLLLITFSIIVLTGCGKSGTPPPGATLTIAVNGGPIRSDPTSTSDITTQFYRVTVVDAAGIPLQGVKVDIQGSFTTGDNITLNNAFGPISPQTLFTKVETGDFGFINFPISAPTFSLGPLPAPSQLSALALTSGGTLTVGTFQYRITALDAATPPGETTESNIATATTTTINSSIILTWPAVPRAKSYNVYGDEGTGTIGKLTAFPLASSSICNALTLVCSFTDKGSITTPGTPPPTGNTTGQGANPVTGTLTATTGALITSLDIAQ